MKVSRKWHLFIVIIASVLALPTSVSTKSASSAQHGKAKRELSNPPMRTRTRCPPKRTGALRTRNFHGGNMKKNLKKFNGNGNSDLESIRPSEKVTKIPPYSNSHFEPKPSRYVDNRIQDFNNLQDIFEMIGMNNLPYSWVDSANNLLNIFVKNAQNFLRSNSVPDETWHKFCSKFGIIPGGWLYREILVSNNQHGVQSRDDGEKRVSEKVRNEIPGGWLDREIIVSNNQHGVQNRDDGEKRVGNKPVSRPRIPSRFRINDSPDFIIDKKSPALPPLIDPTAPIQMTLEGPNSPSVVALNFSPLPDSENIMILPSVLCLQGPSPVAEEYNGQCVENILHIINDFPSAFGADYVEKLLGKELNRYETMMSYLISIIDAALKSNEARESGLAVGPLNEYKKAMEFAAPYIFLPLAAHYQRFETRNVWITYNSKNPKDCHMESKLVPSDNDDDVILPLKNPKNWLMPISGGDPYSQLLPDLSPNNPYFSKVELLRSILNNIDDLFKLDWDIRAHPNYGSFYISVLNDILEYYVPQLNDDEINVIEEYLEGIRNIGLHTHVPRSFINSMNNENNGVWSIDLPSLVRALQISENDEEETDDANILESWLGEKNLLRKIGYTITKSKIWNSQILKDIIDKGLSSENIDMRVKTALLHLSDKILWEGFGAKNVIWRWVELDDEITMAKFEKIFKACINFDELDDEEKSAYDNLLSYFGNDEELIKNPSFEINRYTTYSGYLRRFFHYIVKNRSINNDVKNHVKLLQPHIHNGGPGETPISSE